MNDRALALVVWFVAIAFASAQQSSVEVRSPSAKLVTAAPASIVTFSVVVGNRGSAADEFADVLTLPQGCQKVAPPDLPFRVPAGGQVVRILAVVVPPNMAAGRYPLRYMAQSRQDPSSSGLVDFEILVPAVDDAELVITPQSGPVLAGDAYAIRLRVTNHGNSQISAKLTQRSSLGLPVALEQPEFDLDAGASREIVSLVKIAKDFARHASHAVTFDLTATLPSGKIVTASQASVVEIIPRISGNPDPRHYLPMQHRLIGIAATGQNAMVQMELSGTGTLDEAGEQSIDFIFRGPDTQESSIFGERDEYGISYRGAHWGMQLGDRVYALSPLTERHSLGRGAGITWCGQNLSAGGFWMTTRFRQENTQNLAAFLRYDFNGPFSLQANILRKTGGNLILLPALPQNIYTLEARYHPGKMLDLRLEGGLSRGDLGLTDHAYRIEARGDLPWLLAYSLEYTYAGPDFHGYFNDTDTLSASVTKSLADNFRLHATCNRYAGNLALNDVRSSVVTRESSWNLGAEYDLNQRTGLSVQWQQLQRQDILAPASFDFAENSVRFGLNHRFNDKLQIQQQADIGLLDNALRGESGRFQRYNMTLNWRPADTQTYSMFGGYGPSAFTASMDQALNLGIAARWQIGARALANVSYSINQYDGRVGREQNQVMASLRYLFRDKSSISITGRLTRSATRVASSSGQDEAALLVTYSTPLSMPVRRKRSIGMVSGRVTDASRERGTGVPRVVLQIAEHFAVSDETGQFHFPALKPGEHEMRVKSESLGPHLALAAAMPMKVSVRPADTTFVEIAVTPACSVEVCAKRYQFADSKARYNSGELAEAGGAEAVVVEITNGTETWRAQTDRKGCAKFDRLPAGRWTLRAACHDLPPHHSLEGATQHFELEPGAIGSATVRILPQRRTLRLLDSGSVRLLISTENSDLDAN